MHMIHTTSQSFRSQTHFPKSVFYSANREYRLQTTIINFLERGHRTGGIFVAHFTFRTPQPHPGRPTLQEISGRPWIFNTALQSRRLLREGLPVTDRYQLTLQLVRAVSRVL